VINSVIHHLGIGLQNPAAAERFFDPFLVGYLGMSKERTTEAVAGWKGRGSRIYLYPLDSGAVSGALQHLAFTARTPAEVDAFLAWAAQHGIPITAGPQAYPEYGRDYYAVFFTGPEGLKLELVHLSEADGAEPL